MVEGTISQAASHIVVNNQNDTEVPTELHEYFMKWLSVSADQIVILILLLTLAIKFIFFEDKGELTQQLRLTEERENREKISEENMQSAGLDVSVRQRFGPRLPSLHSPVFPISGMNGDWVEVGEDTQVKLLDKEVQTDKTNLSSQISSDSTSENSQEQATKPPRSVEECLAIYKSEVRNI